MKNIYLFVPAVLLLLSCSQEKRLLHKAEIATARMEYEQASGYYDQVLEKNSDSYRANAGKGMLLAEHMGKHDKAIPYLEKALSKTPKDTLMNLNYSLGKSYHITENYPRALYYYNKLKDYDDVDDPNFPYTLAKRIDDCKYAIANDKTLPPDQASVTSVGYPINTSMPEYGAIQIENTLYFTSKRQDNEKEKKNEWDGKYFESMYTSTYENGKYSYPERYTLPDLDEESRFQKHNEAVISASADGKKLFVYRNAEIYEADLDNTAKGPNKMDHKINFARFQNHAYLANDNTKLFFTSEANRGVGGTDIYLSERTDGKWSKPQLLDTSRINTYFNEDAPYYTSNGVLYFSSNGLPGYGGYDVYKTRYEDGHWTLPENLGKPINSPADDIFFVLIGNTSNGYMSSNRAGGSGDMDIYKVHYVSPEIPECKTIDTLLVINTLQNQANPFLYTLSVQQPETYKVKTYMWSLNGEPMTQNGQQFDLTFNTTGTYTISVKAILNCDSCPTVMIACSEKNISVGREILSTTDSSNIYMNDGQLSALGWNTSPVYFDFDKSDLRDDALNVLDQNIRMLKENIELTFTISGHADARGEKPYNKNLSSERSKAVKNYLIKNGIAGKRIKGVYAFGETMLKNNCSDNIECSEEQHQMNRRVEFKLFNVQRPLALK